MGDTGPAGIARATRPATPADIGVMRAILQAHGGDGPVVTGGSDVTGPYLEHLIAHHRVLVVEEAGTIVAFGAVLDTGRARMLCDLFVTPERLGEGIGRPLLAELFGDAPVRAAFSSDDPRALPLYVRAGMTPLSINLYLEGMPTRLPDHLSPLHVRHAEVAECAALERSWTGADRSVDWPFWATMPAADTFVVEAAGVPVGVGIARAKQATTARALDRLVIRPDVDPVHAAVAAISRTARGGPVQVTVFGPSPLLPVLFDAGFKVVDHDQFLSSNPTLVDPLRLLPNPGML
jgi:GNAT superfamily N-acetyltransferase